MFAIICYAFFPVVYCLYPETSRRTLEDMDEIFIQGPSVLVFRNKALTQRTRPHVFVEAESRRIEEGGKSAKMAEVIDGKANPDVVSISETHA